MPLFSSDEREVLGWIRERLPSHLHVKRIVLFGSRAKGTAHAESDYDVLVVAESDLPFIERQAVALRALGRRTFPLDLLVYTPDEAAREAEMIGSALYWAEREGKVFLA